MSCTDRTQHHCFCQTFSTILGQYRYLVNGCEAVRRIWIYACNTNTNDFIIFLGYAVEVNFSFAAFRFYICECLLPK